MTPPAPRFAAACLGLLLALAPRPGAAAPGGFLGLFVEPERARISHVVPGAPAAAAGLQAGDLVLAVNGQPTPDAAAVGDLLVRASPGQALAVRVERGGWRFTLPLTPGTWGAHHRAAGRTQWTPPGTAIRIAGVPVEIGAPVVTWQQPGAHDGYLERCAFSDQVAPRRPVPGCEGAQRYAARRNLPDALAQVVQARGWTPELAALQIDQVVVHYDVAWTSENCFKVLHDLRGLSCHFLLDVDGVLYQTLDVVERARHAGSANDRSIGIEIAHPGPLELTKGLADRYRPHPDGGVVYDLGRLAKGVRTPGFQVRPARPAPVEGRVQGRDFTQYDYTEAQYRTLTRLFAGLNRALPRIRLEVPRDAEGRIRDAVLAPEEQAAFSGILGHFHVSARKQDPGPAFDWERVLSGARRLLDSDR
jgi:N-acetyl-anhydromuramyl-L-alanine amidase AmpD